MSNARMGTNPVVGGQHRHTQKNPQQQNQQQKNQPPNLQQHNAKRRRRTSQFLELPPELRMMIYRYAFSGLHLWIRHVHWEHQDFRACFEQSSRGLLRTNRLIRSECQPFLYHDLTISSTYRVKRKPVVGNEDLNGDGVADYPFYSRQALNALRSAKRIQIEREISKCYDSFGLMFRHCSPNLQQIELCISAAAGYSESVGYDRAATLQRRLEQFCANDAADLLESCKEKIAKNMPHLIKGNREGQQDRKSDVNAHAPAVEKVSVKQNDWLARHGMICFKTNTRFRIRLDGLGAKADNEGVSPGGGREEEE
ncbi:hypothetical protein DV735_g4258, partial [Chaetothyriales sp. CBS 134920]